MQKALLILASILILVAPRVTAQDTINDEINYNQLEKFIQMAKEYYPDRKIVDEQEKQAKNEVTIENLSYLDMVNVSYFWRPNRKQALNELNPYITNGIQVGINLSPSRLIARPFRVRNAKSNHEIAKLQKQAYDAGLENQVKSLYYNYILQLKNFKQKALELQNAKGVFFDISNNFQGGEVTMEEFDSARKVLSNSEYTKLQSEISFLRARDELEEIIGVKLADMKN